MTTRHVAAFFLICSAHAAFGQAEPATLPEGSRLSDVNGLFMLDYQSLDLTSGGTFDLHGVHYLHQINDWFYAGFGVSAPMFEGDYGGFFSADFTLHAQKKVFGNFFVDAGVSAGAAAGGTSFAGIKSLSGDGTFLETYAGAGYDFGGYSLGVNYSKVQVANSPINDTALTFFFQKNLSYSVGQYDDTGQPVDPADFGVLGNETILGFEYSNLTQINPTGTYGGNIGLVSPHLTQFYNAEDYVFIELDLGASGLVWYNQSQVGFGRRFSLTDDINLYAQLGIGSGGWVTDAFDTGPGFVVYPKVRAEYMFNNTIGVFASAGYLAAPFGTSRNWTLGAGVNFHNPSASAAMSADGEGDGVGLNGLRLSLFGRYSFGVENQVGPVNDLYMAPIQADYKFAPNWYASLQIAPAVNAYAGFAGYVEGYAGVGWESDPFLDGRLQGYGQVLAGLNDTKTNPGILLAPSVGLNYNLTDQYSIYGQVGRSFSVGQFLGSSNPNSFKSTSVGLGLSYRFGVPTWKSN